MKKSDAIWKELRKHLPLTFGLSLFAGVLVAVLYNFGRVPSEFLFEIIHPVHILVSAVATSAIYWRYHEVAGRMSQVAGIWLKTIFVGMSGAILIGSLSDVLFPFLGGRLFGLESVLHLPIWEQPVLILGVAFFGAVVGMYWDLFKLSHLLHVFLSVFASLFYLLAFSVEMSAGFIVLISGLVFLAVYIPCCISDIVFPLLFVEEPCRDCGHWH